MKYEFLNIFLDPKELLVQTKKQINPFLLENNSSQIEKLYNFYKSNTNLLYINGFLGTGKAEIVNYSTAFLSGETIILKYNCFNSTVLDDILLSFFTEFKKLSSLNLIFEPKVKTESFTQKINSYFTQIEKPFVIILDSFEAILDENRKEIMDFIHHLNTMDKIKIIIIGRTFDSKYFDNTSIERVTAFALEKDIFEKYLKSEKIKASSAIIDEFYKHTRGYYFFTALSIKLMQVQDLSLVDFLKLLNESFLPFHKFLEKQALKLIPPTERNLFWFLALIRHPVSVDLLKKLNFYDEEKIKILTDNLIIINDNFNIYVQDYFKDEVDETTSSNILQKIRQYIIDLYSTQLPLKPMERDFCISRQTMRKEIEYHTFFLPRRPKSPSTVMDINYLSYAKVFGLGDSSKQETDEQVTKEEINKQEESKLDLTQRKNIQLNIENLPFQEKQHQQESYIKEEKEETFTIKELIVLIQQSMKTYQYTRAIELCKKASSMTNDKEYAVYIPVIYSKLASAYHKIASYDNALKYYELVQDYYQKENNLIKVNYIKFNIAKIFYETYKIDKAKELFIEISNSPDSSTILIVKSYIQLANLEEDSATPQNAFEYYKLALEHTNEIVDPEVLSEIYFKYALIMDDKNDVKTAIEFYNKCIDINKNPSLNKFLSSAYSNIANLYLERNEIEIAIDNYTKAYETDKASNNIEGQYYSSTKLASVLQKRNPIEALNYFNIALSAAEQTKDIFYIVSATLVIGDYYYDANKGEIALKYYLKALDIAQNNLSQDNIYKINVRINDIKFKLGVEKFDNLVEIIKKQQG